MNNIKITIIWHNDNPIAFWFGEKLIWETNEIIAETDFPETKVSLPLVSAIKFAAIFLQGLTTDRLMILLTTLQIKINELKELKTEPVSESAKDDFFCDKECNRTCEDWDACHSDGKTDDEWNDFEEGDE